MYKNDPRWIYAKFGQCAECNQAVKGKRVFWYPLSKKVYCETCGQKHEQDFNEHVFDEEVYNSMYR